MEETQIELSINGKRRVVDGPMSLAQLIQSLGLPAEGVAVERNREIVKRDRFSDTWLKDQDELEIVTLVGGG